jgi:murein DD-endopeptidase MepM/ murein hydrolase activator NlpD
LTQLATKLSIDLISLTLLEFFPLNKFFTILLIPEKTKQVKKFILPTVYVRVAAVLGSIAIFFIAFMIYDYIHVMQQLSENKRLQIENRQLKQQMQAFTTKLQSVENALERVQTYTTKLRIITNQAGDTEAELRKRVAPNLPDPPMDDHSTPADPNKSGTSLSPDLLPLRWRESLNPKTLLVSNNFSDAVQVMLEEQKEKNRRKTFSDFAREDEEQEAKALSEEFKKLESAFDSVLQRELAVEMDVQSLATVLLDQRDFLNSMPTLKPTNGWYTSGFGVRSSPFTNKPAMHEGLDIANHIGTTVLAPAEGIVTYSGPRPGYGNLVTLDHGYGVQTQFGHVSRFYVRVGEKVKRGDRIAAVGNSGRSTGPHVHYEVRVNGIPVDPYYYILED